MQLVGDSWRAIRHADQPISRHVSHLNGRGKR